MNRARNLTVIDPEPLAANLVDRLEALVEQARTGELSAFAAAVVYRDGTTGDAWSYLPNDSLMIGAIETMKARIVAGKVQE